jgi:tetraacyldisaccharide 4'-kinase
MSAATLAERAWHAESAGGHLVRMALLPLALLYGTAIRVRNRLYDGGYLAAQRVPARVVSVGNLTVGGTGKTPTALWLAEQLTARGRRVGIVARGYRKRRRGTVVVGMDGTPLVDAAEGGDEAVLLARRFAGVVISGERRVQAAAHACAEFGVDTIVLDDGFQHRALARDADLVLLAEDPSRQHLLPAGPLREPVSGLGRARALLTVDAEGTWGEALPHGAGLPCFRARLVAETCVRPQGGRWTTEPLDGLRGQPVVALAGVARPERFHALLRRLGADVRRLLTFPDHHRYTDADLARVRSVCAGNLLVTTEKDLVKLSDPRLDVRAVRVGLEVEEGEALLARMLA